MDRLISEQAVIQVIKEHPVKDVIGWTRQASYTTKDVFIDRIKAIPSADIDALIDGADAVGYRRGYKEAQLAIPSADKWIPVSERLPEPKEYVGDVRRYYLIQNEYGDMMVARWDGQRWEQIYQNGKYIEDEVVAWMPLPSPYKGE